MRGGIFIPHPGPLVINSNSIIGNNLVIHPCSLIGGVRGKGAPKIGNNCFVGHGSKILGDVTIGDFVFIAPGAIITEDINDFAVVVGVNKIISYAGKERYNSHL